MNLIFDGIHRFMGIFNLILAI